MPPPRQQRGTVRRDTRVLAAAAAVLLIIAMLSSSHCLARRVDAAATATAPSSSSSSSSSLGSPREKGIGIATTAVDKGPAEELGAAVHERRMAMEVSINDYPDTRANNRHRPWP